MPWVEEKKIVMEVIDVFINAHNQESATNISFMNVKRARHHNRKKKKNLNKISLVLSYAAVWEKEVDHFNNSFLVP